MDSRRSFLAAGIGLPAAGLATSCQSRPKPARSSSQQLPLRYRALGSTGLKVTELGFSGEAVSDLAVIRQALDLGINFFDTARPYESGAQERALSAALGSRRKDVTVATRSYGDDRRSVAADLDSSLRELKTDYIDIWYLGSKDAPASSGLLSVQQEAQKAGKIRFRGFSTHKLPAVLQHILDVRYDVVMVPYNFPMGVRTELEAALKQLHKAGIGAVAMKVMAGGYRNPRAYLRMKRRNAYVAALRWALRGPEIQTTSVAMRDRDQLEENMEAMAGSFDQEDERLLAAQLDYISPFHCRMCYRCEGRCPRGLPVADVLRYVMYADGYGRFDMGYRRFQELAPELRAVRCAECSRCEVRCPNGVAVRGRLIQAQELFA